jgi:hypothetical protein
MGLLLQKKQGMKILQRDINSIGTVAPNLACFKKCLMEQLRLFCKVKRFRIDTLTSRRALHKCYN